MLKSTVKALIFIYIFLCMTVAAAAYSGSAVLHINSDTEDAFKSGLADAIEGCIVTYTYTGRCDLYTAFYSDAALCGVNKTEISLVKGNNAFTVAVKEEGKYTGCDIKYLLWDNMNPISDTVEFYRTDTFSDSFEPYYPMITAANSSAEEILEKTLPTDFELTDNQKSTRLKVIEMYKEAGFDITHSKGNMTYNIFSIPSGWSKLTPKSLTGNYEQTFSIDACFNRKIPENAPAVLLNDEVLNFSNVHLAIVNTEKDPGGQGTGIARIIGSEEDPIMSLVSRWDESVFTIQGAAKMHVPLEVSKMVNKNPSSDRHAVFIDDTTRTMKHLYKTVPPDESYEYDITLGRLPGYDIRGRAASYCVDLTGIGAEGISSSYASYIPSDAIAIKPSEINNPNTMIEHAVSAAINPVMYGVIYPAVTSDCGDVNNASNFGAVPEGGLIYLDKAIDLKELYIKGKLSLPSYKILKAMQEYGIYNADRAGTGKGYGAMLYTSTAASDWISETDTSFNVPYENGKQGFEAVNNELKAFFEGNEFFTINKPAFYATIPVVKYARLDTDGDGIISEDDKAHVSENIGRPVSAENKVYDVNCDNVIDNRDVRVYTNYFSDTAQHMNEDETVSITLAGNDTIHGTIIISGAVTGSTPNYTARKDLLVSVAAVGYNEYEFSHWTGDFADFSDSIITFTADKDYTIGAVYEKKECFKVNIEAGEGGKILISTNGKSYTEPKAEYPRDTLLYIKAVPNDGYILNCYSGDISGNIDLQKIAVYSDINIRADFMRGYTEGYKADDWECITTGIPSNAYAVDSETGRISFAASAFSYAPVIINKNIILAKEWSLDIVVGNTVNMEDSHGARIIFAYRSPQNYCYFYIGSGGGGAAVYRVADGKTSLLSQYSGSESFSSYPIGLKLVCKDYMLSIMGYKNGREITYVKDLEGSFNGRFGICSVHHGYLYAEGIRAAAAERFDPYAEYSRESGLLNIYGREAAAVVSVILMDNSDNSIIYASQGYTDESGYYSFEFKIPERMEDYSLKIRCNDTLYDIEIY